ncbi:MAG: MFS transporter, partial [Bacillota bacterium]|nr:MFS transporter [Bacillota bacterium]
LFSLLGGVITDKLGRRRTTFIFDMISWSIPCLIWAFSQSFIYFLIAAIVNSVLKVTANSWGCLLVEDAEKENIVKIYTWVYISGLGAAFFAPIAGIFIGKFQLIPTVRALYFLGFIMMTAKFVILYIFSRETEHGKIRMEETRNISIFNMLKGYGKVIKNILCTPQTVFTLVIMLIMSIVSMVNSSFWSIIVTEKIHIRADTIGMFPFIRSLIMMIFFFTIIPKINVLRFKRPLVIGFISFILSQLILVITPKDGYIFLVISIFLEACSLSFINPLLDSMQVIMVDVKERARIIAVLYVIVLALSSPFGYIAGILSSWDRRLPFLMNIILLFVGTIIIIMSSFSKRKIKPEQ